MLPRGIKLIGDDKVEEQRYTREVINFNGDDVDKITSCSGLTSGLIVNFNPYKTAVITTVRLVEKNKKARKRRYH